MVTEQKIREELHKIIEEVSDVKILEAIYTLLEKEVKKDHQDMELSEEHKKILDERLASYRANPEDLLDWEEVKAEIEKRL
jgi:putative addiction module component (TIGR02574 family)